MSGFGCNPLCGETAEASASALGFVPGPGTSHQSRSLERCRGMVGRGRNRAHQPNGQTGKKRAVGWTSMTKHTLGHTCLL